ncbi:MAG: OmpH family outer membrane protein [Bacteroidota bacterium]
MKKIFFTLLFSVFALSAFAQKVGHVNTGILLEGMPAVKAADSQLEALQKQLMAKGEEMVKSFQAEYQAVVAEVNAGNMNRVQQEEKQKALQQKQQEIQQYEQKIQMDVLKKREELLKPILDKVDKAIQEVGKESGFLFIFDTAIPNVILFADEPLDVTDKVKAKLGI